jgi:cellulose synthase/poly-beta-1,6-N-acetylglucosamine synthase-like glycosyltransferase
MTFFLILFWLSVSLVLYTYIGYPLLLAIVSRIKNRPVKRSSYLPSVSFIITAYNEERDLEQKLENTLSLDYPAEKLEIIVASDCSTDRTDEIASRFASRGVLLHRQSQRRGKTAAQNAAVEMARGEIILFSDATTVYNKDVLRSIVRNFSDEYVGAVAGRLVYLDSYKTNTGSGARSYWNYEITLRKLESQIGSLIGVSGCLYAVRKSSYVPLYEEACSDFIIATKMVEQGQRCIFEPEAICTEHTNRRADKEFRMRVRIITQTFTDLLRHKQMLNPFKSGFYAIQLISHKVCRYLIPFFLISIFISSAFLASHSLFFAVTFALQVLFYSVALLGSIFDRFAIKAGPLALPYYFVLTNLAIIVAVIKFISGERYARWEPIREEESKVKSVC